MLTQVAGEFLDIFVLDTMSTHVYPKLCGYHNKDRNNNSSNNNNNNNSNLTIYPYLHKVSNRLSVIVLSKT